MSRICLAGAGSIARIHAEALTALGHTVAAVADPVPGAAAALARPYRAAAHGSVAEAISAGGFERAHVLVPPDLHAEVTAEFLSAGVKVLVEKPLAVSGEACRALWQAAADARVTLGVNQNFVWHPAFARLRALLDQGAYGPPRFVAAIYHAPLRQLAARQFGHWMFREPGNILLEQAVHPLSQILALAGPPKRIEAIAGPARTLAPGLDFVGEVTATLAGARLPASFRMLAGADFPFWQITVTCDDGVLTADMLNNRLIAQGRTGLLEAVDQAVSGVRTGLGVARDAARNLVDYARAQAKLGKRRDAFYLSMLGSIGAFHAAADAGRAPESDAAFGTALVEACEAIRARCFPPAAPAPAPVVRSGRAADVVLLGGSGFIGAHTVAACTAAGLAVRVAARGLRNLPEAFAHPDVSLVHADIKSAEQVRAAIGDAPVVVNLAHGGGGATYAEIERAMVGGALAIAAVCAETGRRLIHIGSSASLYLGDAGETITGATPPDPYSERRGDYARAKAVADTRLLAMHRDEGLRLVLLRPAIVVGEGTSPFHSGVGLFNNEQHCIGWNAGLNPLPFVLAGDVAAAILAALSADGIEGRAYNLAGDVRPSARAYIAQLGAALGRPLRYHPQRPEALWAEDMGKWLIKRAAGRAVARPDLRDFRSRGMVAQFDCADAKRDLGWAPVSDAAEFAARAILIHRRD